MDNMGHANPVGMMEHHEMSASGECCVI